MRILGGIGNERGIVLSGKPRLEGRQQAHGRGNSMQKRGDPKAPNKGESPNCLAGARAGEGGAADVFIDFARRYALGRVATSTRKNYEANWRMWVSWRTVRRKEICLDSEMEEAEMVKELAQYMAFCCALKRKKKATASGKLVTVNFCHGQWVGLSLPISHVRVRAVRQGI